MRTMTTTQTFTPTQEVLAAMFTENTGSHMLDSGGAYGRNWERNAGRTVESFLAEPSASFDVFGDYWYLKLSTFHFLNERLEFDAELQAAFDQMADEYPDDCWLELAERFPNWYAEVKGEDHPATMTVNSYNHDSLLDQTIQYVQVAEEDGDAIYPDYIILQIHGGCDVRGGYTAPKLFRACGEGEVGLLDDSDAMVYCDGVEPAQTETLPGFPDAETVRHQWMVLSGSFEDDEGHDMTNDQFTEDGHPACPVCGAALHGHGMYG